MMLGQSTTPQHALGRLRPFALQEDLRLFHDLPPSLATRLAITVHRRTLSRAPFFNALSDAALLSVLARLRPMIYVPGQVVLIEGQLIRAVNLIKKGQVAMLQAMGTQEESERRVVGQHESFGLEAQTLIEIQASASGHITPRPPSPRPPLASPRLASPRLAPTRPIASLAGSSGAAPCRGATLRSGGAVAGACKHGPPRPRLCPPLGSSQCRRGGTCAAADACDRVGAGNCVIRRGRTNHTHAYAQPHAHEPCP